MMTRNDELTREAVYAPVCRVVFALQGFTKHIVAALMLFALGHFVGKAGKETGGISLVVQKLDHNSSSFQNYSYNDARVTTTRHYYPKSSSSSSSEPFCLLPTNSTTTIIDDDGTTITNERSRRKVFLLGYVGVEGTGHHMIQALTMKFATTLISGQLKDVFHQRFSKSFQGSPGEHVALGMAQKTSLDRAAILLDELIDSNPNSIVFAFHDWSNPFTHLLFSGVNPIDYIDLAQRSYHNVNVNLIVIHRNWTKIIHSTSKSRKFGSVVQKVNELHNSALALSSYLAEIPLCTWRTFDIDDYTGATHHIGDDNNNIEQKRKEFHKAFANFFHTNVSRVEMMFEQVIASKIGASSSSTTTSKYDTEWTKEDLLYVHDAFHRPLIQPLWRRLTEDKYKLLTGFDQVGCENCIWGGS